jgi:hypothetical protein
VNNAPLAASEPTPNHTEKSRRAETLERVGILYARITLGVAFLSGIADRFGLYRGRNVGYGNFDGFLHYTAQVNSFMPAATIPFLAWAATAAELFSWSRAGSRCLERLGGSRKCIPTRTIWRRYGHFFWH